MFNLKALRRSAPGPLGGLPVMIMALTLLLSISSSASAKAPPTKDEAFWNASAAGCAYQFQPGQLKDGVCTATNGDYSVSFKLLDSELLSSGVKILVLEDVDSGERIIPIRGTTVMNNPMTLVTDATLVMSFFHPPSALSLAATVEHVHRASQRLMELYGVEQVTGHSLGGYLADRITHLNGQIKSAFTFSAPFKTYHPNVSHFKAPTDPISADPLGAPSNTFVYGGKASKDPLTAHGIDTAKDSIVNHPFQSATTALYDVTRVALAVQQFVQLTKIPQILLKGGDEAKASVLVPIIFHKAAVVANLVFFVGSFLWKKIVSKPKVKWDYVIGRRVQIIQKTFRKLSKTEYRVTVIDDQTKVSAVQHDKDKGRAEVQAKANFLTKAVGLGWVPLGFVRDDANGAVSADGPWVMPPGDAKKYQSKFDLINMMTLASMQTAGVLWSGYDLNYVGWYGTSYRALKGTLSYDNQEGQFHFVYTAPVNKAGPAGVKVFTNTIPRFQERYAGTYDDFRGGVNGKSISQSINVLCDNAGYPGAFDDDGEKAGVDYACLDRAAPTRHFHNGNAMDTNGGGGQGWCANSAVHWVRCRTDYRPPEYDQLRLMQFAEYWSKEGYKTSWKDKGVVRPLQPVIDSCKNLNFQENCWLWQANPAANIIAGRVVELAAIPPGNIAQDMYLFRDNLQVNTWIDVPNAGHPSYHGMKFTLSPQVSPESKITWQLQKDASPILVEQVGPNLPFAVQVGAVPWSTIDKFSGKLGIDRSSDGHLRIVNRLESAFNVTVTYYMPAVSNPELTPCQQSAMGRNLQERNSTDPEVGSKCPGVELGEALITVSGVTLMLEPVLSLVLFTTLAMVVTHTVSSF
eukprot:GFYU01001647.1.p1 GENE.GFYU01001647.1~~GFYU01001647.1.p1  ORF type:complete len:857 (+),score=86.82 GFYU01001647.1:40-2610(+)